MFQRVVVLQLQEYVALEGRTHQIIRPSLYQLLLKIIIFLFQDGNDVTHSPS